MPRGQYKRIIHRKIGSRQSQVGFTGRVYVYPVACSQPPQLGAFVTDNPNEVTCLPCQDSLVVQRGPNEDDPFWAIEKIREIAELDEIHETNEREHRFLDSRPQL